MDENNPPAFPLGDVFSADGSGYREGSYGMTLRDWFAGQAFAAAFTNITGMGGIPREERDAQYAELASEMYHAADAMLAARNSNQG